MASFNPGRNVGRLSIRVVPDTKRFRRELKNNLDRIEKTTTMAVRVDRANLDKVKIREDIRRQMNDLRGVNIDAHVRVNIDRARLKKTSLRKSIQEQFDKFDNIRVNIEAAVKNKEHFEKEVRDMVDRASKQKVKINVNAITAAATTQMRWVARDRFVNLIVKVSQKSVVSALTTLAALSGARLTWKWIDSLIDKFRELDRNLPAIVGWTTGITSGLASLFAATSGLVGIGQGLFAITPALLVIPGLALNAIGSLTALIVALKNANTELSPLKDEMSELGDIINAGFWNTARQPIIDLVQGLMPQLRTAFHDLSLGIGEFTAAMSRAFGKELANGRLASIFKGIADGWRVLGTGADGFAGALVSLSNIAATYTPRLAGWFVRQANTFDKWLKAISEDGRLGDWMEDAIDAMYDVWDVTRGLAGVFSGLWKAADQAGSGGLHGFGQLMLEWRRTVNSADFQRGLAAIFRGSYVAMSAFGDAVRGIGRLIADNDKAFEKFVGSAGKFLGGLIEGIANALNQPIVSQGLDSLSDGLVRALEGILPHLPRIAETFGGFLGLLGDLAGTLLPTATSVLADLMPIIDELVAAVRPVLPELGDAVVQIVKNLAPAVTELASVLGPAVIDAIRALADGLVLISPLLDPLIRGLTMLVRAIGDLLGWLQDGIADLASNTPDPGDWIIDAKLSDLGLPSDIDAIADVNLVIRELKMPDDVGHRIQKGLFNPTRVGELNKAAQDLAQAFMGEYNRVLAEQGQAGADKLVEGIANSDLPALVTEAIGRQLNSAGHEYEYFKELGVAGAQQITDGLNDGKISIEESMGMLRESFIRNFEKFGLDGAQTLWDSFSSSDQDDASMQKLLADLRKYGIAIKDELGTAGEDAGRKFGEGIRKSTRTGGGTWDAFELGRSFKDEFEGGLNGGTGGAGGGYSFSRSVGQGITSGKPEVQSAAAGLLQAILGTMAGANVMLFPSGQQVSGGLRDGISSGVPPIVALLAGMAPTLQGAFAAARDWLNPQGRAVSGGLADGINAGRGSVTSAAGGLRSAILGAVGGISLHSVGVNIASGLASGIRAGSGQVSAAARNAVNNAISAARRAGEIRSPSRKTEREIGAPLMQGVGVGIRKEAAGVRRSMVNAVDMSGVSGESPTLAAGQGGGAKVALHIHNPTVRDLAQDTWAAAQMAGVLS